MDTGHRRRAAGPGTGIVLLGALAWAFAATSMTAVHAAEARALGPGHTPEMPGEDELALLAHDVRLAALIVVACGLALVLAVVPRRAAVSRWLGGVLAAVVANATLGPVLDGRAVPVAAGALLLAIGAGAVAGAAVGGVTGSLGARYPRTPHPGAPHHSAPHHGAPRLLGRTAGARGQWRLVGAGVLGAGTLPVLALQGTGSQRYSQWLPEDLVVANLVAVVALAAVVLAASTLLARTRADVVLATVLPGAALVVLLEPSGTPWQVRDATWVPGVVLVLACAPLVLAAGRSASRGRRAGGRAVTGGVLLVLGGSLALAPQLLALPVLVGGMLGLVVTMPAGAYVNYDGLPMVGGGVVIALVLFTAQLVLRDGADRPRVPA